MQQWIVALLCDAAAAGGNHQTGFSGQTVQRFGFQRPEDFLAVVGDDIGDFPSGPGFQFCVSVGKGPVQLPGKQSSDGGFAAAGHTYEDNVLHLSPEHLMNLPDFPVGDGLPHKPLGTFLRLSHQHQKSVHGRKAPAFRILKQFCSGGIVDYIQHTLQFGKTVKGQGRLVHTGVHAHRGGVDDDRRVGMAGKVFVIVFSGAGDHDDLGALLPQHAHGGIGSAAAAQHQRLFPGHLQSAFLQHGLEAEIVGVVADEAPVRTADNGIHGPQLPGGGGELVQKGNHGFLIGDGHIQAGKGAVFQEVFHFLRLFFKQLIAVIAEKAVNLGGIAVPQLTAQQSAFHHTTSV